MTTVYLAPGPFGAGGQFFGLGGLPLNLGTISTYAAGSTTPLATYTTSAGSVQNANPIVLGTDGRPPNEIWITGDSYRFDLKDSLGNLIKTYDNLTTFTSSANLSFIQAGTGSVTRIAQDKMREWVSVLDKGADATGVADSATAFTNAVGVSGFALVSSGTYKLSSSPTAGTWLLLPGVTLTGSGSLTGNQIILGATSTGLPFRLISNTPTASQIIGHNVEQAFSQAGAISAFSFGQAVEAWTPTTSTAVFSGQLYGAYGSFSHYGSGNLSSGFGGSFEAFNPGSATATLIVGVNGNASNGGVAAGVPTQTPTNNGVVTNLRGVSGSVANAATGTVAEGSVMYANAITNTGGGTVTNAYGVHVAAQTAGVNNYGFYSDGAGLNSFGAAVEVRGTSNLPASKGTVNFTVAAGTSSPSAGKIYCGDGGGSWRMEFVARTGSADTVVAYVRDDGYILANNGVQSSGGVNGYATGAGGTIAQASSKATDVTLDKASGTITMNNAALNAGVIVHFNFFNSKITRNSVVVTSIQQGVANGSYDVGVDNVQAGACGITVKNISAGNLSEAVVINFAVLAIATS